MRYSGRVCFLPSVSLNSAYKISVKCSQNLTEQGSGCILPQDDKKNDVGNYFLISGWNSFTSLAIDIYGVPYGIQVD